MENNNDMIERKKTVVENPHHGEGREIFVSVSRGRVENQHASLKGSMMTIPLGVKVIEWLACYDSDPAQVAGIFMPLMTEGWVEFQIGDHYERVELVTMERYDYSSAKKHFAGYLAAAGIEISAAAEDLQLEPSSAVANIPSAPFSTAQICPPEEVLASSPSHGALLRALSSGRLATVRVLLNEDAPGIVNEPYRKGWTPLMIAVWSGHVEAVRILIQHKAEVDARTEDGMSALMMAAIKGHEAITQILLAHGANHDAVDVDFKSVLMWAAQGGNLEIARSLLARKAESDRMNQNGMTALDYAVREGHAAMIELLESVKT